MKGSAGLGATHEGPSAPGISGFQDPATDFSDGLAVLLAYHERFLVEGQRLVAFAATLAQQGLDEAGAAEALRLAEWYENAMPLHHRDEERALFPRIVNRSFLIDGMIERLALDHDEIEAAWGELAPLLRHPEQIANPKRLSQVTHPFEKLLREHIVRENEDFFPKLETLLASDQRRDIGLDMARLRGRQLPSG
ncbi:MAG: hemerythrin domain-containing protein [Pseudomonadota bacterium]|nr:hemerythrin domain-containing protein [Pseudomonadota bacterium]